MGVSIKKDGKLEEGMIEVRKVIQDDEQMTILGKPFVFGVKKEKETPRYIDAKKLEKYFKRDEWNTPDERWRPESEFGAIVDSIPAADVQEVKRGNWIVRQRHEHYPSGKAYDELVCPFCKRTDHNGDGGFCGYCGAIMDGEE